MLSFVKLIRVSLVCLSSSLCFSQTLTGTVLDSNTHIPVSGATVYLSKEISYADFDGNFSILFSEILLNAILIIAAEGYKPQKISIIDPRGDIKLGEIYLEKLEEDVSSSFDISTLSEQADDEILENMPGVFQPSKDLFLRRAAFDFGQSFFKLRGYSFDKSVVMINGIPMNDLDRDIPSWSQWGGLNDLTSYQDYQFGISYTRRHFGGLLGLTNLNLRPEEFDESCRVTFSASNKSYTARAMATYTSGLLDSGWAYAFSVSRRAANEGYIQGTLYDAYSVFAGISKKWKDQTVGMIGFYTPVRRGLSSPITDEVYSIRGRKYNPYWGYQEEHIRNSRTSNIKAPTVMLYYHFQKTKWDFNTAFSFQRNISERTRLDYMNAQNPDPSYYRKMPSYFLDKSESESIRERFIANSQINWNDLYVANGNPSAEGVSSYILYADASETTQYSAASSTSFRISKSLELSGGANFSIANQDNYAIVKDMLGSTEYEDIDVFSGAENNVGNAQGKSEGDKIKYYYKMPSHKWDFFLQALWKKNNWEAFLGASHSNYQFQREGLFQNGLYEDSFGKGTLVSFNNFGAKGGIRYKVYGNHELSLKALLSTKPPGSSKVYYNARNTNSLSPSTMSQKIYSTDFIYSISGERCQGKLATFFTKFQDAMEVRYFYSNSGLGSDFFQEVTTGIDSFHAGLELSFEYDLTENISINSVASTGQYRFLNDPNVNINFNTSNTDNSSPVIINKNLGKASLKNYAIASGPQQAYSLGLNYNTSNYWWISPSLTYMTQNYISISNFLRTSSFFDNPNDPSGFPFPEISGEMTKKLLSQQMLPSVFLFGITAGKSWYIKNTSLRLFAVLNNILDATYKTGGYEQTRAGNYQTLSEDYSKQPRTFGPKYWYGYGRTFFLNTSWSF